MDGVSVITCTIRPKQIDNVFENYARQMFENKELIIILNRESMKLRRWLRMAKRFNNVHVHKLPHKTLGGCLNFGIRKARYSCVAKFDDDDYYAPQYLTQAVDALETTDASMVGKGATVTYFQNKKILAIRKPDHESQYLNVIEIGGPHLGGGTMVFKKNVFPHVKFPVRTLGEDIFFQKRLLRRGYKIYSMDRFFYVSIRYKQTNKHTWDAEDEVVLKECDIIDHAGDYKSYSEGG